MASSAKRSRMSTWPRVAATSTRPSTCSRGNPASPVLRTETGSVDCGALNIDTIVYSGGMPKTEGWLRAAGNLLVLARLKAEISQSELAERAGVAQSAISAYERGVRQPTLPTLFRLLAAAGFDLRLRLAEPDNQERAAAEWERNQPAAERRRWAAEQRRVAGVPLER